MADFVANVSHELKTPLTSISYIGERLKAGRYRSEEEAKEFYGMLNEETERLKELIESVLDFSRMAGGKRTYARRPVNMAEVVDEALLRLGRKISAGGFAVEANKPAAPLMVSADRTALIQAAVNLLDNAMKYSGDSRSIRVTLEDAGREAVLSVRDAGVGISAEDKKKIFEKFYRVETTAVRITEGGVGLGLAMVKHIAEGHGGRVTVDSAPGQGSVFSIHIPKETKPQ
jgi:two-component system phosphate regulon sensor histidine kinase PhoR